MVQGNDLKLVPCVVEIRNTLSPKELLTQVKDRSKVVNLHLTDCDIQVPFSPAKILPFFHRNLSSPSFRCHVSNNPYHITCRMLIINNFGDSCFYSLRHCPRIVYFNPGGFLARK